MPSFFGRIQRLFRRWRRGRQVGVSVGEPTSTSTTRQTVDFSMFAASKSPEAPTAACLETTTQLSPAAAAASSEHSRPEEASTFRPPSPYEQACRGLPNPGQTCFMNAAVQFLLSMNPFIEEFGVQFQVASTSSTMRLFGELVGLRFSNDTDEKTEVLETLKHLVAQYEPAFDSDGPNSAYLFVMSVLDMLQFISLDLQRAANALGLSYTCPVAAHISFEVLSTVTCSRCEQEFQTYHNRNSFDLDPTWSPGGSVKQCLDEYLTGFQRLDHCSCGSEESVEQWSFLTLPNVLILVLKRIEFSGNKMLKVRTSIRLSRELMISSSHLETTARYSLVTTISHLGRSADYGHYICESVYDDGHDVWLCYSDDDVYVKPGSLLRALRRKDACVLYYEKQG